MSHRQNIVLNLDPGTLEPKPRTRSLSVLAIVTSSPSGVEGGHLVIARALVEAARESGHDAHLVLTPECTFGRQVSSYVETFRTDVNAVVGRRVDRVISLRFPSYAIRHPVHVCWLNHTMREYYDEWPRFAAGLSARGRIKERIKKAIIRTADGWLLKHNVTRVVAQSPTIQRRLATDLGIRAAVLLPPPPPRPYRCDGYADYVFAVSRLTPLKRLDLLIRALAHPDARGARAVIAGEGEAAPHLTQLVAALDLKGRVSLLGRISDEALVDHLARCRTVCFPAAAEDYGFVTVEAFASRKAVITCTDSGGPADVVRDNETGIVSDPTPQALARAIARMMDERGLAERLGSAAAARAAAMSWASVVEGLVTR